ncbi:MAG TPA: SURF1 family protein [Acidimicrobiales bacterium]|jgi:surfeit locus 1 family protein
MERYRFALRPRWILSHVLIVVLVIVMINLGFWQLRRLHEKKAYNASVRANEAQPVQSVQDVLHPGEPVSVGHGLNFRRVTATGTYDTSNEIIVRARSLNTEPGVWALTPLRLDDGSAVIVLRGFLPSQGTLERVPTDAEPPSGPITVTGLVQETQTAGTFEANDPANGKLTTMARVDVARIAKQMPYPIEPAYLQLQTQQPAQAGQQPLVVPEPVLDEGPHFSYAVQWFIFSTIAVVGYPLILRRKARDKEEADDDDEDTDEDDLQAAGVGTTT